VVGSRLHDDLLRSGTGSTNWVNVCFLYDYWPVADVAVVKNADAQNLKEKHEIDLKKEIKKLQRLRDQIKTWIGSSEVKDKDALVDARKLIETKMEQFKVCEKETKTKTYSKEGLARADRLDPAEEAKMKTTEWLAEYILQFKQLVEEKDFEIEKLSSGKGKKSNKHQIEELKDHISNHKFHISKLEGIIRLVTNDVLDVESVDALKEDIDYYFDSYADDDYMAAYDEEFFYESLGLEELDVINVDRLSVSASTGGKKMDDATSTSSRGSKDLKSGKKSTSASIIPLTIGRARTTSGTKTGGAEETEKISTSPAKPVRSSSTASSSAPTATRTIPAAAAPPPVPAGASMAAILKRETEQQEKDRQAKVIALPRMLRTCY
jgi:CCR4-NOT transcription complex subunit 3